MAKLTWEDVLRRENLIGGDIEYRCGGVTYRGPLAEIQEDGHCVCFLSPWYARLNSETNEWENWYTLSFSVSKSRSPPQDIGRGCVLFFDVSDGVYIIFPKNGSKLEPRMVKRWPKTTELIAAFFPELPFDRAVVERVCRCRAFGAVLERLPALKANATIEDVLALFGHDSQAEEFLWLYIEIVAGKSDARGTAH